MVYVLIGAAGTLGAILRYLIGISLFTNSAFPHATLTINLIGSFLLAWLTTGLFKKTSLPSAITTAIGTGFIIHLQHSHIKFRTVTCFKTERSCWGSLCVCQYCSWTLHEQIRIPCE